MTLIGTLLGERLVLTLLRGVFLALLAVSVLSYGAVLPATHSALALAFSVPLVLSTVVEPDSRAPLWIGRVGILLALLFLCILLLQTLPVDSLGLAHPYWRLAQKELGEATGTISINPAATLDSVSALLLPFMAFSSAIRLFSGDRGGVLLWRFLCGFGTALAVFAIAEATLAPRNLMFGPKTAYIGDLTAPFVNRNTAATFYGLVLLGLVGLLIHTLHHRQLMPIWRSLIDLRPVPENGSRPFVLYSLGALVVLAALMMTRSRAGIVCSLIGSGVAIILAIVFSEAGRRSRRTLLGACFVVLAGGLLLFTVFAERAIDRLENLGEGELRWCVFAATGRAIEDNWVLGTGFGTFRDAFPAYRDAACGNISLLWDKAHNVFLEGFLGLGVVFVPLLLVGYVALGASFFRGLRQRRRYVFAPCCGVAALTLVSLHSLVDFSVQIPGMAAYLAAFLAACAILAEGRTQEINGRPMARPIGGSVQSRKNGRTRNLADLTQAHGLL